MRQLQKCGVNMNLNIVTSLSSQMYISFFYKDKRKAIPLNSEGKLLKIAGFVKCLTANGRD